MAVRRAGGPSRKKPDAYHHGDLSRALVQEAVRTIEAQGVEGLTLRAVALRLGVSRTALYRHFADKQALLVAVAAQGFRALRTALVKAWEEGGRGRAGFEGMGMAYVRFALDHPSHYRVMFGGTVASAEDPVTDAGADAFQALVDALVEQQARGEIRDDPPRLLALYIWSVVHGIAMLALDGQLKEDAAGPEALMAFANQRLASGIGALGAEAAPPL